MEEFYNLFAVFFVVAPAVVVSHVVGFYLGKRVFVATGFIVGVAERVAAVAPVFTVFALLTI